MTTQTATPTPAPAQARVVIWWTLATTAGLVLFHLYFQYGLYGPLSSLLTSAGGSSASPTLFLLLLAEGAGEGLLVGGAQWLVLRRYVRGALGWIVASLAGWMIFYAADFGYLVLTQRSAAVAQAAAGLGGTGALLLFEALAGLMVGLAQGVALRRCGRRAWLWIGLAIVAQLAGFSVARLPIYPLAALWLGWISTGAVGGLGLAYLLTASWPGLLERGGAVTE